MRKQEGRKRDERRENVNTLAGISFSVNVFCSSVSPLSAAPRVKGTAVTRVRELGLGQLGQARQRGEGLESEGGAGSEEPHLAEASGWQRAQRCGGNIPGSQHNKRNTAVSSLSGCNMGSPDNIFSLPM